MKIETWVVGCTIGSRREVAGERKPVIREDDNDDDDDNEYTTVKI
jgi:hypothetical protein